MNVLMRVVVGLLVTIASTGIASCSGPNEIPINNSVGKGISSQLVTSKRVVMEIRVNNVGKGNIEEDKDEVIGVITGIEKNEPVSNAAVRIVEPQISTKIYTDKSGSFKVSGIKRGKNILEIVCPTRCLVAETIIEWEFEHTPGTHIQLRIHVPRDICIEPEYKENYGEYKGYYYTNYEVRYFRTCNSMTYGFEPPPNWLELQRIEKDGIDAWVDAEKKTKEENENNSNSEENSMAILKKFANEHIYYVEWSGKLEGPGSYGNTGIWAYRFTVEHIRGMKDLGEAQEIFIDEMPCPP